MILLFTGTVDIVVDTPSGKSLALSEIDSLDTVDMLKIHIQMKTSIPFEHQRLLLWGGGFLQVTLSPSPLLVF